MKARIFDIKHFAVHDGPGIRTTVFFKGCPLKCVWCHNPEGIDFKAQLAFFKNKCIACGECAGVCPQNAHTADNRVHRFNRKKCIACGRCEDVCFSEALKLYGKEITVDELMPILLEDMDFYLSTGGGVTLSGGECLAQADFCAELLKSLKSAGINTAVDTCGFVSKDAIDRVISYVDIFLYDIKAFDENIHIKCTGQTNKPVLENLKYIDMYGKNTEIRIPYVPDFNQNQIEKIAAFLSQLKNITNVRILPYHNYAGSKYISLGMLNTLPELLPNEKELKLAESIIKSYGLTIAD